MNSAAVPGIEAGRRRRQLPVEVSAFVGRADELGALDGLLRDARHVTVTGPGGVGKTRLALHAAAGAADRYPDGICLVELSALPDPAGTVAGLAVARSLGLRGHDPRAAHAAVLGHLRGKRLLLILDTCEHLAPACARFAAELLRTAGEVTLLTTSRQPLHVPGERCCGSARCRCRARPRPGAGRRGRAVRQARRRRAPRVRGHRRGPARRHPALPAARRHPARPRTGRRAGARAAAGRAGRASRVPVHRGDRRAARHRAPPADAASLVEWSYDLCTEDEQTVWDRLSVFAGPFDLAAAREVAACPRVPADRVGDVLGRLVDKSVVVPVGETRYRLLGSEREYAAERLAQAGQEAECRRRHARRYLKLARGLSRHLLADDQAARLRRLRAEQADVRACSGTASPPTSPAGSSTRPGWPTRSLPYWLMSGLYREGVHWQDAALAAVPRAVSERANALAGRAALGAVLGLPESAAHAREAITVAAHVGDDWAQARGYLALQLALGLRSAYPQAVDAADEARRRLTALGADVALRCLDVQLAQTHQIGGNLAAARRPASARWPDSGRASAGCTATSRSSPRSRSTGCPGGRRSAPARQARRCAPCGTSATRSARPARSTCSAGWRPTRGAASAPPGCSARRRRGGCGRAAGRAATPSWRGTTSGRPTPPPARSAPTGTRSCTPGGPGCRSIRSSNSPSRAATRRPAARSRAGALSGRPLLGVPEPRLRR